MPIANVSNPADPTIPAHDFIRQRSERSDPAAFDSVLSQMLSKDANRRPPPAPHFSEPGGFSAPNGDLARKLLDPVGTADDHDIELVAREIVKAPRAVLGWVLADGGLVKVCRGNIAEYRGDLKGKQPSGWPKGNTMEDVPGIYLPDERSVVLATSGHNDPSGPRVLKGRENGSSYNLPLHELAHAYDDPLVGSGASDSQTFNEARNADLHTLSDYERLPGKAGRQETYAESFARFYGGDPDDEVKHPNLHRYWATREFWPAPPGRE